MQIIFEDKDERSNGGGANSMDPVIYIGRISGCVEGEYVRRFRSRENQI